MGSLGDKFKKLAGDQTRQLLQNFQNAQSSKTRNGYSSGKLNEDGTATLADGTVVQVEVKGRPGQYAPVFNLGNGQGLVDQPEAKFFNVDSDLGRKAAMFYADRTVVDLNLSGSSPIYDTVKAKIFNEPTVYILPYDFPSIPYTSKDTPFRPDDYFSDSSRSVFPQVPFEATREEYMLSKQILLTDNYRDLVVVNKVVLTTATNRFSITYGVPDPCRAQAFYDLEVTKEVRTTAYIFSGVTLNEDSGVIEYEEVATIDLESYTDSYTGGTSNYKNYIAGGTTLSNYYSGVFSTFGAYNLGFSSTRSQAINSIGVKKVGSSIKLMVVKSDYDTYSDSTNSDPGTLSFPLFCGGDGPFQYPFGQFSYNLFKPRSTIKTYIATYLDGEFYTSDEVTRYTDFGVVSTPSTGTRYEGFSQFSPVFFNYVDGTDLFEVMFTVGRTAIDIPVIPNDISNVFGFNPNFEITSVPLNTHVAGSQKQVIYLKSDNSSEVYLSNEGGYIYYDPPRDSSIVLNGQVIPLIKEETPYLTRFTNQLVYDSTLTYFYTSDSGSLNYVNNIPPDSGLDSVGNGAVDRLYGGSQTTQMFKGSRVRMWGFTFTDSTRISYREAMIEDNHLQAERDVINDAFTLPPVQLFFYTAYAWSGDRIAKIPA